MLEHSTQNFAKDGRRFVIEPATAGWAWSVRTMSGEVEACGLAPSKSVAAAFIVRATLAGVEWPAETGLVAAGLRAA